MVKNRVSVWVRVRVGIWLRFSVFWVLGFGD